MINLNPKIWGPHAWFFIESIAISLPDTITLETQNELKHFFISISFLLPCETCRNHFSEYIKKTDIMNIDFSTKTKVLTWINNIHNEVRKRNKCKTIPIDKTVKYYNEKYNIETKSSYVDIFFVGLFIIGLLVLIKYLFFNNTSNPISNPIPNPIPNPITNPGSIPNPIFNAGPTNGIIKPITSQTNLVLPSNLAFTRSPTNL